MLLSGWTRAISRPECNHSFESVFCVANLFEDIGPALPYLNAVLGGAQFSAEPPFVMFHHQNRIIKVGATEISINALADETEADKILGWLKNEINEAWENRESITPCYKGKEKPVLMKILMLLPKTNCKSCGLPTCMAFAAQVRDGGRDMESCTGLGPENREKLAAYLSGFDLEA